MMRLLQSEFKKIWKSKLNMILLLILFVFSGWRIYDVYSESELSTDGLDYPFQDVEGNEVKGFAYYQFADEYHHQFAGELQASTVDNLKQDFDKIRNSYVRTIPDDAYMRLVYDDDYEIFLENARSGVYDNEQLRELLQDKYVNGYSSDDGVSNKAYFEYYYKEDRVLALYSILYRNYYGFATTKDISQPLYVNDYYITSLSSRLENRQLPIGTGFYAYQDLPAPDIVDYYDQKYLETSYEYDSNIGNTLFTNALFSLEFTSIMILILILSNTFAMEKHHKIDQILVPTTMGWRRITMAKVGCGMLLSVGIVVVQVCIALFFACILLPMRDLNLTYFGQAGLFMDFNVAEFIYSYKEIIGSGLILMILATMATSLVTCLCSYLTKNNFLCAIPLLLIALLTGSMYFFDNLFPGTTIDMFFPSQMVHFTQYFQIEETMRNIVRIGSTIVDLKDVVIVFWVSMIMVLTYSMYVMSKRHVVKTK